MRKRAGFRQLLGEILGEDSPLSYGQLQGLSNPTPEDMTDFRASWPSALRERRQQIVRALTQMTEDNADVNFRDILLFCLTDQDEEVRVAAIEGLGDDESINLLERLLVLAADDPSAAVRSQAILALGRFVYLMETTDLLGSYRQRLLQLLLGVFNDGSAPLEVRRRSIETLSYLSGSPEVEEAIGRAYGSAEREMRVSAIHAMGHNMSDQWRPTVTQELSSSDPEMRYEAAYACGEVGDPCFVPLLAPLLEDEDHEVARAAIWALGEIGGAQARRLLQGCLRHSAGDIREAAEEALNTLEFFEDPMRVL